MAASCPRPIAQLQHFRSFVALAAFAGVSFGLVAGCGSNEASFRINGAITESVAANFLAAGDVSVLYVSSPGGDGAAALKIASAMLENETHLVIDGFCSSACAEFLIPAASEVTARNRPIVSVHGNPLLIRKLFADAGIEQAPECIAVAAPLEEIYKQRGRSLQLALAQEQRLGLTRFLAKSDPETQCYLFDWKFAATSWLPTSEEYASLMGLAIDGELCSDSERCLHERVVESKATGLCRVRDELLPCTE